jgi:hypothetical protein
MGEREMSVHGADKSLKFLPFYAILQDGLTRLFEVVKSDEFRFIVNGDSFESSVAEAVLISPTIHEVLQNDQSRRTFVISGDKIGSNDFGIFLEFVRCQDCNTFSDNKELSLLSICRLLGNERLARIFLASKNLNVRSISTSNVSCSSADTRPCEIEFCDANVEYCASQFHSSSV